MSKTALFLSTALTGQSFSASASFGGETRNLSISNWGGSGGGGDTTPPVLSVPTGVKSGSTGGVGSVITNEAGGTLYWVVTTSTAIPSAAQIQAGQTHTGATAPASGSQAVPGTGAQTTSPAAVGLSPSTTYYFHFVQADGAGNESNTLCSPSFMTDPAGSGTGTVTIAPFGSFTLGVAPHPIWFNASVSDPDVTEAAVRNAYDESYHDLLYVWDFGDPNGAASGHVQNLPLAHNNMNRAYGKKVAHVFSGAGPFTVTCTVYKEGGVLVGTDSYIVTAQDIVSPDAAFPGTRTILVDPAGQGDQATYPGSQTVTTFAAGLSALSTLGTTGRVLLKRGESYPVSAEIFITSAYPNLYLGNWGNPNDARPQLAMQNGFSGNVLLHITGSFGLRDAVVDGIRMTGLWDSVTETGVFKTLFLPTTNDGQRNLLTDCELEGGGYLVGGGLDSTGQIIIHNSDLRDWGDYGFNPGQGPNRRIAIIGTAIRQNEQAFQGGDNKAEPRGNRHGPIRIPNAEIIYMACNDIFSRNGWSGGNGSADQSCLRAITGPTDANAWTALNLERCAMEGGLGVMGLAHTGTTTVYGSNVMIDKCLMVASAGTRYFIGSEYPGVTVRNCIFVKPNAPIAGGGSWYGGLFRGFNTGWNYISPNLPVKAYNNTHVNWLSDANRNGNAIGISSTTPGLAWSDFPVFNLENNVQHTPNVPSQQIEDPVLTSGSMITVGGTWTSRFHGLRFQASRALNTFDQLTMDATYATDSTQIRDFAPDAGSPLINDAIGLEAIDDFYCQMRHPNPDRGAIERT